MLGNRTWEEWVAQYEGSHQHPVNRACHTVGIPAIEVSLLATPLLYPAGLVARSRPAVHRGMGSAVGGARV